MKTIKKAKVSDSSVLLPPPAGVKQTIVIIGGGVTGALSALELAKMGHKVTLIEAGSLGNGSSSRSAACIRQQFQTPSTVQGMIFCTEYYKHWKEITGSNEIPIVQSGYLFLKDWTNDPTQLEQTVQMQREAGLTEVEILSVEQVLEKFPYIAPIGITGATWCETDGFLYPGTIFSSAAEAAQKLGATIITNDAVVSATRKGMCIESVTTKSGQTFSADIFVNAAGAWAPKVSKILGGMELDIKARKRYLYFADGENVAREFLTDEHLKELPMIITPNGGYVRPESFGSHKVMMGWLQHTNAIEPVFEEQDKIEKGYGISNTDEYGYAVHREIGNTIPDIQSMPLLTATSGLYEETPDHNPFIGYDLTVGNLIICAGCSGHGLMTAPFNARIVGHYVNAFGELGANTHEKDVFNKIILPEIGEVDITPFKVGRSYAVREGMVI